MPSPDGDAGKHRRQRIARWLQKHSTQPKWKKSVLRIVHDGGSADEQTPVAELDCASLEVDRLEDAKQAADDIAAHAQVDCDGRQQRATYRIELRMLGGEDDDDGGSLGRVWGAQTMRLKPMDVPSADIFIPETATTQGVLAQVMRHQEATQARMMRMLENQQNFLSHLGGTIGKVLEVQSQVMERQAARLADMEAETDGHLAVEKERTERADRLISAGERVVTNLFGDTSVKKEG